MTSRKRELISKKERESLLKDIISFFSRERGEEIGVIAAEAVLDFFLEKAGGAAYNKGVADAKAVMEGRLSSLELDLDALLDL